LPDGLTAVVATLPDGPYAPEAVNEKLRDMDWVSKAALGHEQLLEMLMRTSHALLPMKLLTLFSADERLIKDLTKQRRQLARAAQHVAGCEEYGLRLFAVDAGSEPADSSRPSSGLAFLERKKQVRDDARERGVTRSRFAKETFDALVAASRDAVARPAVPDDLERPLLDAAFLVSKAEKARFGKAVETLSAAAAGAHCSFKLTGPWPPYHFVQKDDAS
jgi:hypothetical protein